MAYQYQTLTITNLDGSISPFSNGASGQILLGTGNSTPPQWATTLPVTSGGTGANFLEGILIGNGTSPFTTVSISGVNNGDVLAKTANGYAFITLGSATVPPIIDLQSGAVSGDAGKFLKVNTDLEPEWASISSIVGDYLPLAGGAMLNTCVLCSDIFENRGWYYGLVNNSSAIDFSSGNVVVNTSIGATQGTYANTTGLGDYTIHVRGYLVSDSSRTLDFYVYLSNTSNGQKSVDLIAAHGFRNYGSVTPTDVQAYDRSTTSGDGIKIAFKIPSADRGTYVMNVDFITHDLDKANITNINDQNTSDNKLLHGWQIVNTVVVSGNYKPCNQLPTYTITDLQSGTDSTTGKILLGGANASSSPTWVALTSVPTGLTFGVAKINASGYLTSGAVSLTGSDVTGTLPVAKGGTGLTHLGTANQVLTSNGSTMAWADKANAAVTADKVAHHLGFTVKNGNSISTLYYDGSAAIDGGDLLPIQRYHSDGVLIGTGTHWTSAVQASNVNQVLVSKTAAGEQAYDYEFKALSTILPSITGLASGSTNAGYILSVGAAPGYTPTWIPLTDLNVPAAPSTIPLEDNDTGAVGTAGTYATATHIHPKPYFIETAKRLYTPRVIGITGAITAYAQEFDGSNDLMLVADRVDPYALTQPVPIEFGGTGATTAANARTNLGAAASDHNHDTVYLKLSGGSMTGWITFPSTLTSPITWPSHSGIAYFGAGELSVITDASDFVHGNTEFRSYFDDAFYQTVGSYLERVTLAHTNGKNTNYNIAVGDQEPSGSTAFTRNIKLPAPSADNLGDELTVIFTNKNASAIGTVNCNCETSNRLVKYDYSTVSSLSWGSGNIVKFVCIQIENNGTTYYWRAIKQVEQSW